ncbi:dab2-interacting protein, putative [Entamoeba invadens IP1]|uniref:Dab2-interacting protein, putative n=1 Tax=Entamoeba invadens IP1 TaxID=370355 RepID=A0A0A1U8E2_ENTIV|nr:dab2-interacting protein, putative [Entamoeba invadens IP1]ELP91101.1 dab2-interacting protein, putative [Entamoeba invadens IP1]|eukprot:XP_004257872.1 dab2-interacting protein, putative [Entamoeba invadens IP1]
MLSDVERKVYQIKSAAKWAEKSTDVDFNEVYSVTQSNYEKIIATLLKLRHYNISLKENIQKKLELAHAMVELSEENIELNTIATKYVTTCQCLSLGLDDCLNQEEEHIFWQLRDYTEQYKVLEQRLLLLNKRHIDMDRFHNSYAANIMKKKPSKSITLSKAKYEQARDFFFYLRNEMIDDMKKMNDNFKKIVEPLFVQIFRSDLLTRDFQVETLRSWENFLPSLKEKVIEVTWLITPDQSSCVLPEVIYEKRKDDINRGGYNLKATKMVVENALISPDYITDIPMMPINETPQEHTQAINSIQPSPTQIIEVVETNTADTLKQSTPQPQRYRVLYDYEATEDDEVSLKKDDIVLVYVKSGDWWEGEVNGLHGLVPSNFLFAVD